MGADRSQASTRCSERIFRPRQILRLLCRRIHTSADVGSAMRGRVLPAPLLGTNGMADDDMAAALPAEGPI